MSLERRLAASLAIAACALALWLPATAQAYDYTRAIRVDWEPIPGAESYDLEWYAGADCAKRAGEAKTKAAFWASRLPGGLYCVRVRGIGLDERAGQWTDFQKLEVRPKAPQGISSGSGGSFSWDSVPYAKAYRVQVVDSSGKVVHEAETGGSSYTLPEKFAKDPRFAKMELKLQVRTLGDGVAPSPPGTKTFFTSPVTAAMAGVPAARAALQAQGLTPEGKPIPKPRVPRKLPPQPVPEAVEPEEAVDRFVLSGEVPIAPTLEDWKQAHTPEQKESLRRRTIASERVELIERVERSRPPSIRVSGGGRAGDYYFLSDGAGGTRQKTRSFGEGLELEVEYNRERPWGMYFRTSRFGVDSVGVRESFQAFGLGVERNVFLDSLAESVLTFSLGAGFTEAPVTGGASSIPLGTQDLEAGFAMRFRVKPDWTWASRFSFRGAPTQTDSRYSIESVSSVAGEIRTGAIYSMSPSLDLEGGYAIHGVKTQGSSYKSELVDSALYLSAAYRLGPVDGRNPAAETSYQEITRRLWSARLEVPFGSRTVTSTSYAGSFGGPGYSPKPESESYGLGALDFHLRRKFWADRPGSIEVGGSQTGIDVQGALNPERSLYCRLGYDVPLLKRQDATFSFDLGPGMREAVGAVQGQAFTIRTSELGIGAGFEKEWTDQWATELRALYGATLGVSTNDPALKSAQNLKSDGDYYWSLGASAGYRLSPALSLWGGYSFQLLRYSITGNPDSGPPQSRMVQYSEGQLRVGVGFQW